MLDWVQTFLYFPINPLAFWQQTLEVSMNLIGLGAGIGLGIIFAVIFNNPLLFAVGVAVGVGLGFIMRRRR